MSSPISTSSPLESKFEPSTSLNSSPELSAGFAFFGGAMVEANVEELRGQCQWELKGSIMSQIVINLKYYIVNGI